MMPGHPWRTPLEVLSTIWQRPWQAFPRRLFPWPRMSLHSQLAPPLDSGSGLTHALGGAVDLATDVIGISSSAVSGALSPIVVAADSVANPTAEVINDDGSILTSAGSVVEIAPSVVNTTSATLGSDLSGLSHSVPAGETHLDSIGGTTLHEDASRAGPGISLHPISSLQNADPEIAPAFRDWPDKRLRSRHRSAGL